MEKGRNKKVMKSSMKKLLALFVCICMLMSGSVYAQEKGTESQDASDLKAQEAVENAEAQEQSGEAKAEGQTPSEASKSQEKQKEETKPERQENKAKKTKDAKQAASAVGSVAINETNFPDANFRKYVKAEFDKDGDDLLLASEIAEITYIAPYSSEIGSLKGVEYFSSLEKLYCWDNKLKELDLSDNENLSELKCHSNNLTRLIVRNNKSLQVLECDFNQLAELDVSGNPNLEMLGCGHNRLTVLDVSRNTRLTQLECYENNLMELDLSKNTSLMQLGCNSNKLTELNLSENRNLEIVQCFNNNLRMLDISGNTSLFKLICANNQLKSLDVTTCTQLDYLDVRPLAKEKVKYSQEPTEFLYGSSSSATNVEISISPSTAGAKAEASGINVKEIRDLHKNEIPDGAAVAIDVKLQEAADPVSQKRIADYAEKFGDKVLKLYEVNMGLYVNGQYHAEITDNFGKLRLSLYAGKEYAGKTAVVYQLHEKTDGTNEVISYKNLTIGKDGMVNITVDKLSTFAVALQNTTGSGADATTSPQTGDSANMMVWIMMAVLSMAAIPITIGRRQKR